ncbi:MAG: NFACT family protein, partial [Pyrinomonadaceae bacterium]|nr:NFACT family protein [Pyrinomonadaceae bacterium]
MDNETLQLVVNEILPILQTRIIGKIFQLERNQLAIDFRPGDGRYLFLNFEPNQSPRLHLIRRRVKELEKNSDSPSNFVQFTRKRLSNALLMDIAKDENDRIISFAFLAEDENFAPQRFSLIAQFAGR